MISDRFDDVRDRVASVVGMCLLAYPHRDVPLGPYAVLTRPSCVPAVVSSTGEECGTINTYAVRIHLPRDAGQRDAMAMASAVADDLAEIGCRRLAMMPVPLEQGRGPAVILTVQQVTDNYFATYR